MCNIVSSRSRFCFLNIARKRYRDTQFCCHMLRAYLVPSFLALIILIYLQMQWMDLRPHSKGKKIEGEKMFRFFHISSHFLFTLILPLVSWTLVLLPYSFPGPQTSYDTNVPIPAPYRTIMHSLNEVRSVDTCKIAWLLQKNTFKFCRCPESTSGLIMLRHW